jgi:DNA-binding response OmpR family regulator
MQTKYRVLLVDDETEFLETTGKRLSRRGYEVQTATTCAEALRIVEDDWPQIVVLDVMLPDQDGIECLRNMKNIRPQLVVLMLTGHASMQTGLKGMEYGANDYCLKPIEFDELEEKIQIACQEGES